MIRLAIILSALYSTTALAQSESTKQIVVESMKRECLITQRKAPENSALSNEALLAYCNCFGDHSFEVLTFSEMEQMSKKPVPDAIQKKVNVLAMACYN